jgi:hypothetical protein
VSNSHFIEIWWKSFIASLESNICVGHSTRLLLTSLFPLCACCCSGCRSLGSLLSAKSHFCNYKTRLGQTFWEGPKGWQGPGQKSTALSSSCQRRPWRQKRAPASNRVASRPWCTCHLPRSGPIFKSYQNGPLSTRKAARNDNYSQTFSLSMPFVFIFISLQTGIS